MEDYTTRIERLKELLKNHKRIVFFGGAGVSTESGIPDFRSAQGIYSTKYHDTLQPEEIVSHHFFMYAPEEFYHFYFDKMVYEDVEPNDAHKALAYLEETHHLAAIVTQNIDGLHQKAGNYHVYELHGTIMRNYCMKCHKYYSLDDILKSKPNVPKCSCGGLIKPDVVLYEEGLDEEVIMSSLRAIQEADLLIIAGTSLVVQPAASFVNYYRGQDIVMINKGTTAMDNEVSLLFHEAVGQVLRDAVLACKNIY